MQVYTGKLSLVDLAGSERASETNNIGRQLKDGANINRCTCVCLLLLLLLLLLILYKWSFIMLMLSLCGP